VSLIGEGMRRAARVRADAITNPDFPDEFAFGGLPARFWQRIQKLVRREMAPSGFTRCARHGSAICLGLSC
jgi:hypothetical protein